MVEQKFSSLLTFWTLLKREILRFLYLAPQTVLAPLVTGSLYLLVFGVSLGSKVQLGTQHTYLQFIVPGLVMMGIMNNAFMNTSSSLFFWRFMGSFVDMLVTPLTPFQYVAAYTLGAMARGLLVGGLILVASLAFTGLPWVDPIRALGVAMLAAFLFSQMGILVGLAATSWDSLSMYSNFLILPLIYLGGMFYPSSGLPPFWAAVSRMNPLYYLMDGFRGAILGEQETSTFMQFALTGSIALGFSVAVMVLFSRGWRIKS